MKNAFLCLPDHLDGPPQKISAAGHTPLDKKQKKLGYHYRCVCGEPLIFQPFAETPLGPRVEHFRVHSRTPHEQLKCDWLTAVVTPPALKMRTPRFEKLLREGFRVILNLPSMGPGIGYGHGRLKALGVPDAAHRAEHDMMNMGGRYENVPVKNFGDLVKTLTTVVDTVGHLDDVYVRHGQSPRQGPYETGLRPIKEMLFSAQRPAGYGRAVRDAALALKAYQGQTTRRDAGRVNTIALFPVLMRVQPSNAFMKDLVASRANGTEGMALRDPTIRGTATRPAYLDRRESAETVIIKHDVVLADAAQRQAALGAFAAEKPMPVYALATPRVDAGSYWKNPTDGRPSQINFKLAVGENMLHVGRIPTRVLDALIAPRHTPVLRPNPDTRTAELDFTASP